MRTAPRAAAPGCAGTEAAAAPSEPAAPSNRFPLSLPLPLLPLPPHLPSPSHPPPVPLVDGHHPQRQCHVPHVLPLPLRLLLHCVRRRRCPPWPCRRPSALCLYLSFFP